VIQKPTDDALMARAAEGDPEAFARLVERHLAAVHRVLGRATGDSQAAEDLAQETFLLAWQRIQRYEARGRFRA